MRIGHYLRRTLTLPPHRTARIAWTMAATSLRGALWQVRDAWLPTFRRLPDGRKQPPLPRLFSPAQLDLLIENRGVIERLAAHFAGHRFNLLGSDWTHVRLGMPCGGLEGCRFPAVAAPREVDAAGHWLDHCVSAANLREARRRWKLIEPPYEPIDWQIDFKSGFHWSSRDRSQAVCYGDVRGADIKVPWELARMQHLPVLAYAAALAGGGHAPAAERACFQREFRNQVIDFAATNPPRFGANWVCTMDVAIRAANWIVAYDLFRALGFEFDPPFEGLLTTSLIEHGRHIVEHLEWSDTLRGNHYLANVCGLLIVATYLHGLPAAARWRNFARQQVLEELRLQFLPDGANFEASTSYHRLSTEMVLYALAIDAAAQRVADGVLPTHLPHWSEVSQRLAAAADFARAATRPDGRVIQIGDNDSGRFLKLWPGIGPQAEEEQNDHSHLLAAIDGFLNREPSVGGHLEYQLVRDLVHGPQSDNITTKPRSAADLAQAASARCFPDFGLAISRSHNWYVALRAGPVGQRGQGGHAHNDQLSLEVCWRDQPLVVDPGTYVYTPLPEARNHFRSTGMHNTLGLNASHQSRGEQNAWVEGREGLFRLEERSYAAIVECTQDRMVARHHAYGAPAYRRVEIDPQGVSGLDELDVPGERIVSFILSPQVIVREGDGQLVLQAGEARFSLQSSDGQWHVAAERFSPAYGHVVPTLACRLHSTQARISWRLGVL